MRSELLMLKIKHLHIVDRFVTLTMGFSMGFLVGMNHPEGSVIYWCALIGICAFAKVELYHWGQKLETVEKQQRTSKSLKRAE